MILKFPFSFCLLVATFFAFTFANRADAQDWINNIQNDSNFFSIQKAFYSDPDYNPAKDDEEQEGPDELYKRWEHLMMPRVYPSGNAIAPNIIYKEWAKYQATHGGQYKRSNKNGDWSYVGPIGGQTSDGSNNAGGGGTGRVNCVRFTPGNPNIIWAGTPSGGLWKSTDGGNTWNTNTDNIPNLGVTDIAINPRNTDTMFMATGDAFGFTLPNNTFRGGLYSNGVMRSIDGGNTWDTTSLNWDRTLARQIYRLLIYPENPNIIIAVTNKGTWRSADGGNTWKNVLTSVCTDLKMNITNHGIMYAGGSAFYVSKDTGATWTKSAISFPILVSAMTISTCPSSDSTIYLLLLSGFVASSNTTLIRTTDNGKTWQTMSKITQTTFQGYYDASLNVNPVNANEVTVGGVDMFRSSDGGLTWAQLTNSNAFPRPNFSHADHRVLEYYPGSKDTLFDGNDGGLFRSTDGGTSWKLISNDIQVLELYRIGSSSYDPTILYTGAQDNGTIQWYKGNWTKVIGGDGMTCKVAWDDASTAYASYQSGNFEKTQDYGASWFKIYPTSAGTVNWTAPFEIDPEISSTIYFGGSRLYKSTDAGNTWTNISKLIKQSGNISNIGIAPLDGNTIYVSLGGDEAPVTPPELYRTTDGGNTWDNISKPLDTVLTYLTCIAVDRRDAKHIGVTFSGYAANQKVSISKDGGATFTNMSAGLPNLPVNCIAFEYSDENGIFVGTDAGVFYRSDTTNGWIAYNNGLPNVIVNQIEIFPSAYKIRAATYGRGIWDGVLAGRISGIEQVAELKTEIKVYPNPSTTGIFFVELPTYNYQSPELIVYNMMGQKMEAVQRFQSSYDGNPTDLDLSFLPDGIYTLLFSYPDGVVSKKIQVLK